MKFWCLFQNYKIWPCWACLSTWRQLVTTSPARQGLSSRVASVSTGRVHSYAFFCSTSAVWEVCTSRCWFPPYPSPYPWFLWLHLDIQPVWNIFQDTCQPPTFVAKGRISEHGLLPKVLFSTQLLGVPGYVYLFYQIFSLVILFRYLFTPSIFTVQ